MGKGDGRGQVICHYRGCTSTRVTNQGLSFFYFPKNPDQCEQWLVRSGNERFTGLTSKELRSRSIRLCALHFEESAFKNILRQGLNKNAIPRQCSDREVVPGIADAPQAVEDTASDSDETGPSPADDKPAPSPQSPPREILPAACSAETPTGKSHVHSGVGVRSPLIGLDMDDVGVAGPSSQVTPLQVTPLVGVRSPLIGLDMDDVGVAGPSSQVTPLQVTPLVIRHKRRGSILKEVGYSKEERTPRKRSLLAKYKKATKKVQQMVLRYTQQKEKLKSFELMKAAPALERLISDKDTFSPAMSSLIMGELRNRNRPLKARRWQLQDKIWALAIMKRSPRCYEYLRKIMTLPSPKTLRNLLDNLAFRPGLNEKILAHLAKQASRMNERDKCCVVLFDEMSLRSGIYYNESEDCISGFEDYGHLGTTRVVANHALVFMVRGLAKKWKQPIAYYFTCDTVPSTILAQLIRHVISALIGAGLNVVGTVCDQGPTNRGAIRELSDATPEDSSGTSFKVDGKTIFIIYDPPHLLKCIRNILMKNNVTWWDKDQCCFKTAKWEHLQKFFELDQLTARMALKLTLNHLKPEGSCKMRVNLAAQLLSHTVAAGMLTMATWGDGSAFPKEAMHTAEFVELIDKFFDSVNGSTLHPDRGKELRCVLSDRSPHLQFWEEMRAKVLAWRFTNSDTGRKLSPPTVSGILITMVSIAKLWEYLKTEKDFRYLSLKQLDQDALENLFGNVRQHGICNVNPTTIQFTAALKTATITNLSRYRSRGANCELDGDHLLSDLRALLEERDASGAPRRVLRSSDRGDANPRLIQTPAATREEESLTGLRRLPTAYVCGYIAKRLCLTISCPDCRALILTNDLTEDHLFISLKEYNLQQEHLNYPTKDMVDFVESLLDRFSSLISEIMFLPGVKDALIADFANVDCAWINCPVHIDALLAPLFQLFCRVMVHNFCKKRNRMVCGSAAKATSNTKRMKIVKHT